MEKSKSKEDYFAYIPEEILIEILLLLPFESVIACKLVSKEWNNLIKNPSFVTRYRNGGPLALFVLNGKIYSVLTKKTDTVTAKRSIISLLHPQFSVSRLELESLKNIRESTIPMGANGTCCFETTDRTFIFYDLITGSRHEVESDTTLQKYISRGPKMTSSFICCGYGYDCYEDDYKLLVVWIETGEHETVKIKENGLFCVYSMRNRGWKQLDGFPYDEYDWWESDWPNRACSMNGVLNWVVANDNNRNGWVNTIPHVIVTYDMHSGRFEEILLPDGWSHFGEASVTGLTELGGKLCCWNYGWDVENRYQVWAMKEYGVRESWTKLLSIEDSGSRRCFFKPRNRIEPTGLCETQDGRKVVLFVNCQFGTLYWYDIDNDKVKTVRKNTWLKNKDKIVDVDRRQ